MAPRSACLLCFALATLLAVAPGAQAAGDFVQVNSAGSGFQTASCPDFVFSGYNTWQAIEAEAGLIGTGAAVGPQFDAAVQYDLTVVRMFGFSVQQGINDQYSPGVYNESMLVAFDKVIAAASQHNLKLIIALANNWDYNGNMSDCKCWYTNQSRTATGCDDFFADSLCRQYYLENAKTIMQRNNTVTGIAYNEDPTIMSWDLINEGRCEANCTAADIQAWTAYVAPLVKSYAPKQLITVGQDGFFQADNCAANTVNPVPNSNGWPLRTGEDFLPNHDLPGIDYTSIHLWPDNWDRTDLDFGKAWINAHLEQTRLINKPLVLEEFGKAVGGSVAADQTAAQQLGYYQLAYAITEGSINSGDYLRGIAFWRWDNVDPQAQLTGFDQQATISTPGEVFQQVVQPFSGRVTNRCPGASGSATSPTSSASSTSSQASVPTSATASNTSTSTAGRRLLQTGLVPSSQVTGTTAPVSAPSTIMSQPGGNANALVTGALCVANCTVPGQSGGSTCTNPSSGS